MANWTGLAGMAGLAAALENIQDRRVKEAQLQQKLTEGKGDWLPATGGGGGFLGGLDQFLGYNKPGQIGFGGQRYEFQPFPTLTEADVRGMGLTIPQTTTTPAYDKPLPPDVQGPLERVPEQQVTTEVPLPGFIGTRMDPKTRQAMALERFKEHRDLAKLREEYRLAGAGLEPGGTGAGATTTQAFVIPGTTAAAPAAGTPVATPVATPAVATPTGGPAPGMQKLSPQFHAKAQLVANRLGINLDDFYRVMAFETGGEFSPATKNRMGSGATGLIQFTEPTAKGLGTTPDALAKMTPEQQLDYVEKHLAPHKGKMGNLKDLYMAVLYPAAVGKPEATVLFTPDKTPKAYLQNAGLDTDKKGYVTVGDAVAAVQRTYGGVTAPQTAPPAAPPAAGGTGMQVAGPGAPAPPTARSTAEQDASYLASRDPAAVTPAPPAATTGTQAPPAGATGTAPAATSPATTTGTASPAAPATGQPPAPYTPSQELLQQVERNKQTIATNDARMNQIEIQRRMAEVQTRKGMPGAVDRLRMYSEQWAALDKQNKALNKESEDAYAKERGAWQAVQDKRQGKAEDVPIRIAEEQRGVQYEIDKEGRLVTITKDKEGRELTREVAKEARHIEYQKEQELRAEEFRKAQEMRANAFKLQEEERGEGRQIGREQRQQEFLKAQELREQQFKRDQEARQQQYLQDAEKRRPGVEAAVTTAVQDASMSEDLRNTKADMVAKGLAPEKDWKDYNKDEKAAVTREHVARTQEFQTIEKMDVWDRTALYAITKRDGTPIGRASTPQLAEARRQGAIDRQENAKGLETAKAQGKMDGPIGESDAFKYIDPKTGAQADPLETPRQALASGKMLMDKPQQLTVRNARNSLSYVNRMHVLYFGGDDPDGSLTGEIGKKFEGIYPAVERFKNENQSLPVRARNSMALRMGILEGKPIAQWAQTADDWIAASLGQISRDMGGERGHFTDRDAERSRKFFANLGTRWWGESVFNPNFMTARNVAENQLRLMTGVISDRVRGALNLKPSDKLPWDTFGRLMPAGQTEPAARSQPTPPAQVPAAARQAPAAGTPAAPVTPPPAAPTSAPAPTRDAAPAPEQRPAAAQPEHRQQQLQAQYPPGEFPGRTIRDPVTGKRYTSDGTTWQEVP